MIQNGFRLRELLRPRRVVALVGAALLAVTVEAVKYFTEEAAFENARLWLVARARAAMTVLQFIAAHAWWIPWGLVPFTVIIILIWTAIDARKLARSRMIPIEQLEDRDLYAQAKAWLSKRLAERKLHVEGACLFGSIMHDRYPTSDVDVAVWFKPIKERQLRRSGRELKTSVAEDFERTFGHRLHVQLFSASESANIAAFLTRTGKHEVLKLAPVDSRVSTLVR